MEKEIQNLIEIDTRTLVDRVEDQLIDLLKEKKLKVGDQIPKELELAEGLGVSRTVIREALTRLRLRGLIETKKKKGTVIINPDIFSNLKKSLYPEILDDSTLKDLFELRLVLEIGMADLIFQNIQPADIEELYIIVGGEPEKSHNHKFKIDHEVKFHGKLYEITGNTVMKRFQKMLLPIFDYVNKSDLLKKDAQPKSFVSHKELVDILAKGTPEEFRNGMRSHLENYFIRLFDEALKKG